MSGASKLTSRRPRTSKVYCLQKPRGQLHDRVQAVGPEHFGILCFDCAKGSSKFMLADFYARTLIEPTTVAHTRGDLQATIDRLRQVMTQHDLRDVVVAVERTGEYHRPVQRAFRQAHYDVRLVHPYATKHYRQPADPGNKTDNTDLAAIFRVTLNGFGLVDPVWPDDYQQLQLLRRYRRDLVNKSTELRCQIREKLHAAMPGYAEALSLGHFWDSSTGMFLARRTGSAEAVRQAGADGLGRLLQDARVRCLKSSIDKLIAWAHDAPPAHPQSACLHTIISALDDDRLEKTRQIRVLERQLASFVVRTPYLLLLAIPGINIICAADLAGEMGPIHLYPAPNHITGRAGLMPCRYQSDRVDVHGPLRRAGNRRLRAALMQCADNLIRHNDYYRARAARWQSAGKDPRWIRVKIAKCFSRLVFAMLTTGEVLRHPCCQSRHYVLGKLLEFHTEHGTPTELFRQDMLLACERLPKNCLTGEAQTLNHQLNQLARKRGPHPLADLITIVLARVRLRQLQSETMRSEDPNTHAQTEEPTTP
jgi:transposase